MLPSVAQKKQEKENKRRPGDDHDDEYTIQKQSETIQKQSMIQTWFQNCLETTRKRSKTSKNIYVHELFEFFDF